MDFSPFLVPSWYLFLSYTIIEIKFYFPVKKFLFLFPRLASASSAILMITRRKRRRRINEKNVQDALSGHLWGAFLFNIELATKYTHGYFFLLTLSSNANDWEKLSGVMALRGKYLDNILACIAAWIVKRISSN